MIVLRCVAAGLCVVASVPPWGWWPLAFVGVALLDEEIRGRLVDQRDNTLMEAFGLSTETQGWLRTIKADSLVELAQAIVSAPQAEYAR